MYERSDSGYPVVDDVLVSGHQFSGHLSAVLISGISAVPQSSGGIKVDPVMRHRLLVRRFACHDADRLVQ